MAGHNSFGYVQGPVTDEEVELIQDSDENDQYLDCKSCVCQLEYSQSDRFPYILNSMNVVTAFCSWTPPGDRSRKPMIMIQTHRILMIRAYLDRRYHRYAGAGDAGTLMMISGRYEGALL